MPEVSQAELKVSVWAAASSKGSKGLLKAHLCGCSWGSEAMPPSSVMWASPQGCPMRPVGIKDLIRKGNIGM